MAQDNYGIDSKPEALFLQRLGVYSNFELLKAWCQDTPQSIFPKRKIGLLKEGYEASFLVLPENPVVDFHSTEKFVRRFKLGQLVTQKQ